MKTYKLYYKLDLHKHVCEAIIEAKNMQEAIDYLYEDMEVEGEDIEILYKVEEIEYVLNINAW